MALARVMATRASWLLSRSALELPAPEQFPADEYPECFLSLVVVVNEW
jgi:hypothetical protein